VSEPNPVGSPAAQPGGADRRRHSYLVNDLKVDNRHPDAPVVATELVGSNAGGYEPFARYLRDNPHIRSFDNRRRGYTRCAVIRQRWYIDLRVVDTVKRRRRRRADPGLLRGRGRQPRRQRS
jgi:phosphodiesterase/alkaline phosphatase D-like protein